MHRHSPSGSERRMPLMPRFASAYFRTFPKASSGRPWSTCGMRSDRVAWSRSRREPALRPLHVKPLQLRALRRRAHPHAFACCRGSRCGGVGERCRADERALSYGSATNPEGKSGEPGYDQVLSRTHNPFTLRQKFEAAGSNVQTLFYHYHCLPPMFEQAMRDQFRKLSVAMEDPTDWRGHFMASAFILAGVRR